jgi:ribosome biogenesis GTPase A
MVVGIPNVGKSSLINCLAGKKTMKVEDRPGVTKNKQWIKLSGGFELLDTPGILWPKFEDKKVGLNLAFCGAIKDDIIDIEEVCVELLVFLKENYKTFLEKRYNIEVNEQDEGHIIFNKIGFKRGFLISGGEVDAQRTSKIILDEFRGVKIGRISLEKPRDLGGL